MRNNFSSPAPDGPPRRLPILLRRAWFSLNQAFRRRCAELGLTPDQYTALRTLLEGDRRGMRQSDLVQAMSSDPNTIASLLRRMEGSGWIVRQPHEADRRAHRVRLLPSGRRLFYRARRVALALQAQVLAVLPEAARENFLEQLELVADACRQSAQFPAGAGGEYQEDGENQTPAEDSSARRRRSSSIA